jgi:hypothetical protein
MSAASAEHTRHDTALLLRLLKPNSGANPALPLDAHWDWRNFARTCDYHQVASFIYCRIRSLPGTIVPPGLLEHLRVRFLEVSGRNYHLAQKLVDLTTLLEQHQIPVLAYKGPTLAMAAYGDLALRSYQDLDLVIQPEHLLKAADLMTRCGFEIAPESWNPCQPENLRYVEHFHEIMLRAPDRSFFVDLHWQLAPDQARAFRLDVGSVWGRAEKTELLQTRVSTLSREDLFLALCCHGAVHRWARLKWLLDIAELLRKNGTLSWSRVEEIIRNRPLARTSASLAVLLARDLLEIDVSAEAAPILPATERTRRVAAAICDEIMSPAGTTENYYTTLLALEGNPVAWTKYFCIQYPGWWFNQVFVQVSPKERALVPLPERLQFLYHFIRPLRLVLKHGRRVARALWSMAAF